MEEPDLAKVFKKPGSQWSESEIKACLEWFFKDWWSVMAPQVGRHLGKWATAENVREFWSSFAAYSLHDVIRRYDPDRGRSFESYVFLCLKQECWRLRIRITEVRTHEQSLADLPGDAVSPVEEDESGTTERRDLLWKALNKIDPRYADVLRDLYFYEKSVSQIANERKVPPNTVKSWLLRGRKKVKAALAELDCQKQRG
ncbi:MAG TPA: sigma-70 family RNA polymerase sigma factor [Thermoanaerobaculia bacterium]|nr:sigma-70 family RNA polymerase sigma factor [Thermoanaerobaculia bacterium]